MRLCFAGNTTQSGSGWWMVGGSLKLLEDVTSDVEGVELVGLDVALSCESVMVRSEVRRQGGGGVE